MARWQLLTIAALGLSLTGATGFVANYQPLTRGHYWQTSPCFEDLGTFSSVRGDDVDAWEFVCSEAGEEVEWAISLINNGRLPITITNVAGANEPFGVIGPIEVSFGKVDLQIPRGDELQTLRPFTIRPGEEYVINFHGVTRWACAARDTGTIHPAGIGITYRVGPFTRHDRVDSGPAMNIRCSEDPDP